MHFEPHLTLFCNHTISILGNTRYWYVDCCYQNASERAIIETRNVFRYLITNIKMRTAVPQLCARIRFSIRFSTLQETMEGSPVGGLTLLFPSFISAALLFVL